MGGKGWTNVEEMKRELSHLAKVFQEKENGAICAQSALEAARYISGLPEEVRRCAWQIWQCYAEYYAGEVSAQESRKCMEKIERGVLFRG